MNVGQRIKHLRLEKKISQTELGDLIGVSQDAISSYENGRRQIDVETANKLAAALGVRVAQIVDDSWSATADALYGQQPAIDVRLMAMVIKHVLEALDYIDVELEPPALAEVIALSYQDCIGHGTVDAEVKRRVVKLVVNNKT